MFSGSETQVIVVDRQPATSTVRGVVETLIQLKVGDTIKLYHQDGRELIGLLGLEKIEFETAVQGTAAKITNPRGVLRLKLYTTKEIKDEASS